MCSWTVPLDNSIKTSFFFLFLFAQVIQCDETSELKVGGYNPP